jgi:hypothetical protein
MAPPRWAAGGGATEPIEFVRAVSSPAVDAVSRLATDDEQAADAGRIPDQR